MSIHVQVGEGQVVQFVQLDVHLVVRVEIGEVVPAFTDALVHCGVVLSVFVRTVR